MDRVIVVERTVERSAITANASVRISIRASRSGHGEVAQSARSSRMRGAHDEGGRSTEFLHRTIRRTIALFSFTCAPATLAE